jgi:hypothetical protein
MYFVLADHFGKADAQLARTHGTREAHQHFFALGNVFFIAFGSIYQGSSIKMQIVFFNESGNGAICAHDVVKIWCENTGLNGRNKEFPRT